MAKKLTIIIFNSSKITRCRCTGPLLRTILKKKKGETGSPFAILAGLYFFFQRTRGSRELSMPKQNEVKASFS